MLNGAEQYFSRNLSEVSVRLNEYRRHLLILSLWYISRGPYHFSTIQTINYLFRFFKYQFFCGRQLGDYFPNQVASTKILVSMAPKVVAAWRVGLVTTGLFPIFRSCQRHSLPHKSTNISMTTVFMPICNRPT